MENTRWQVLNKQWVVVDAAAVECLPPESSATAQTVAQAITIAITAISDAVAQTKTIAVAQTITTPESHCVVVVCLSWKTNQVEVFKWMISLTPKTLLFVPIQTTHSTFQSMVPSFWNLNLSFQNEPSQLDWPRSRYYLIQLPSLSKWSRQLILFETQEYHYSCSY